MVSSQEPSCSVDTPNLIAVFSCNQVDSRFHSRARNLDSESRPLVARMMSAILSRAIPKRAPQMKECRHEPPQKVSAESG
jgi:hypothetical protein